MLEDKNGKNKTKKTKPSKKSKAQKQNEAEAADNDEDQENFENEAKEDENTTPMPIDTAGKDLLQVILDKLNAPSAFKKEVPCLVKGDDNKLVESSFKLSTLQSQDLVLVAGSVCKDWSSMNSNRSQLLGRFVLPFATMVGLARFLNPKLFVHECTRQFDTTTLAANMPQHRIHTTLLEPRTFGLPVRRGRSYCALVHRSYTLEQPVENIRKFFTTCDVGCEVFYCATNAEVGAC